ncbi:MAG: DNA repair protein RecO [Cytophagia bacterium]|nr:DNA repair protein RecO [Cytophagia bacterium]NVK83333.1 DNA repair protein RecO [Cytophagia bacterium]
MLHHTQGIVLGTIKYSETSIIARVFTRKFGSQSYIVNGVRSKKSRGKIALYQPLSLLDMVVYYKPEKDIQRISEARFSISYQSIPFEPTKRAIGIFLMEVFSKVLRNESENESLYSFLEKSLTFFDHQSEYINNFHLQLLLKATTFMGFGPQDGRDLIYQLEEAGFHFSLVTDELNLLDRLMNEDIGESISISNSFRRDVLDHIIKFYQAHTESLKEIKSLEILKTVMSS